MGRWSEDRVISASPDDASLAAARKLARPGPWSETGSNGDLVWGKCQGSGKCCAGLQRSWAQVPQ
jgi:hypothetical protein